MVSKLYAYTPKISPALTLKECIRTEHIASGGDLATMMGLSKSIPEVQFQKVLMKTPALAKKTDETHLSILGVVDPNDKKLMIFEHPNKQLPKAVMFRDSYTNTMMPYLNEHFSRIAYYWSFPIRDDLVLKEKPDIVIHQFVGRQFSLFDKIPQMPKVQPKG